jgi:hypothetical protein
MAHDQEPRSPRVFVGTPSARPRARRHEHDGAPHGAQEPSVGATIDAFLDDVEDRSARDRFGRPFGRAAARELHWCLGGHVREAFGAMRIGDVRRGDVEALVYELRDRGVSSRRLRAVVECVRALYDHALDRRLVAHNPALLVAMPDGNTPGTDAGSTETRSARAISLALRVATLGCLILGVIVLGGSL